MYGQLCTEFYDADKNFSPNDEVSFYLHIFSKNDLVLEPMCGSGRLLIPLLQAGLNIHGIDNSKAMLESCKKRAKSLNLIPVLIESNIEDIFLPEKYDGIIIPLGSLQLFYPREVAFNVLQIFKNHLKPNGKLIMDLFIPWDALYKDNEEEFNTREIKTSDGSIIKSTHHNKANKYEQIISCENNYKKYINNKLTMEEKENMHICWYYRYEVELILEKYEYHNIQCVERFLNGETYMTFIAENS